MSASSSPSWIAPRASRRVGHYPGRRNRVRHRCTQGGSHPYQQSDSDPGPGRVTTPARNTMDTCSSCSGRAACGHGLAVVKRFTLDTAGTGTGFVIHQATDSTVPKMALAGWAFAYRRRATMDRARHLDVQRARGTLNGDFTITADVGSGFDDDADIRAGLWSGARACEGPDPGTLP